MRSASPSHRPSSAFTLLELLVAMTVLALLLGILLSMVNGASQLWRESENRVDSYREARAALNVITSDLQSIYASPNPEFFQWASEDEEDEGLKTEIKLDDLAASTAPPDMGDALFFLSALPTAAQPYTGTDPAKSDLCAVGYFLAFGRPGLSGDESCNLYRQLINSDDTFDAIQTTSTGSGNPLHKSGTAKPSSLTTRDGLLARNVVEFRVDAKSYTRPDPDPATPEIIPDPTLPLIDFEQSDELPMPDVLEITIVAVNEQTADQFGSARGKWNDKTSPLYVKNARTFSTRVYLTGAGYANDTAYALANATPTPTPTPTP